MTPLKYSALPQAKLSASSGWVKQYDEEARRWRTMEGTRAAQLSRLGGLQAAEELIGMSYHPQRGVTAYRGIPYQFDWREWDFDPKVSIVALQEPFKIRTISIADGPATAAASPFQKVWHRTLRKLRPFQLIGGARVADALESVFTPSVLERNDGGFVSGDYSAATDRLSLNASRAVLDGLLASVAMEPELRRRIVTSLTAATLDYSQTIDRFKPELESSLYQHLITLLPSPTKQTNGQLMGNVLSFPILCIVNLCGFLTAHLRARTSIGVEIEFMLKHDFMPVQWLDGLPVLVNGDDILFQANHHLYQQWLSVIAELGLKPSMGKNYFSEQFLTINSELFIPPIVSPVDSFGYEEVRPTGFQLVQRPWFGGFETDYYRLRKSSLSKGDDVLSADPRKVLPKCQQALLLSVPEADRAMVNRLWIDHQQEAGLLQHYTGLNWFLPLNMGGFGLDPVGYQVKTTYAQQKLANRAVLQPDEFTRFLPKTDGSLTSESARLLYRKSRPTMLARGEIVEQDGKTYVLDKNKPVGLEMMRDGKLRMVYVGYPAVTDMEAASPFIQTWLDYHVDGQRFDAARIEGCVKRMLLWGLRLSDRKCKPVAELDTRSVYRCFCSRTHVAISRKNA
jgi:hypothetical protein